MPKPRRSQASADRMIQVGLVAWLVPGAAHYLLGQRALGVVFFVAITLPFIGGLLLGGLKASINPYHNHWLFLAEMGAGGYTIAGYVVNRSVGDLRPVRTSTDPARSVWPPGLAPTQAVAEQLRELERDPNRQLRTIGNLTSKYMSAYPAQDVAQIYLATAGLLNVLVVLDALTRAQTGGLPTYYRELSAEERA